MLGQGVHEQIKHTEGIVAVVGVGFASNCSQFGWLE